MNRLINPVLISMIVALLLFLAGSGDLYAQGHGQRAQQPGPGMHRPPSVDQIFAKDDTDGDNLISRDEFGGPAEHFSHFDTDDDGYLSREEVTASLKHPPRNGGQGRNPGSPPPPVESFEEYFARSDIDGDGVLNAEEFTGPPDHFALIDTDQDGVLTEEELADARDRITAARNATPPRQAVTSTDR